MDYISIVNENISELRSISCFNYRLRMDRLVEIESKHPGILYKGGTNLLEIFTLAHDHAEQAVVRGDKYWHVDTYIKNKLRQKIVRLRSVENIVQLQPQKSAYA